MSARIGRNDPCPCGSGRKYKHCCGGAAATRDPDEKGHAGAVERALDWVASRHRNAAGVTIEEILFAGLTDEERATLEKQDDETWQQIRLNANEWLLAEATIQRLASPPQAPRVPFSVAKAPTAEISGRAQPSSPASRRGRKNIPTPPPLLPTAGSVTTIGTGRSPRSKRRGCDPAQALIY